MTLNTNTFQERPSNQSVGVVGDSAPLSATLIAGVDSNGLLQYFLISSGGGIIVTPTAAVGLTPITQVRLAYPSTNVTTGAWVQLIASLPGTVNQIGIFDSSGQTMALGIGGSGSEVQKMIIFPGGNGTQSILIPSGSRISIISLSGTANAGEVDINFFQ